MKNSPSFSTMSTVAGPLFGLAFIAIAAASIVTPAPAGAQTEPAAEFTRAQAETRAAAMFDKIDLNSDGVLDSKDREARSRTHFDAMDSDKNGEISFTEFEATRGERGGKFAKMHGERGDGKLAEGRRGVGPKGDGPRGVGPRGNGPHQIDGLADANSDGKVSKQEFTALAMQRFERADANDDGTISADERRSHKGGKRGMDRSGPRG